MIVSGGSLELTVVQSVIREEDFIIGVDRGINFLDANQICPDYLVGDFDSVDGDIIERYKKSQEIPLREFHPVKDASDTEIAVRLAMEMGYEELVILGATGSRVDHMWANIQVLSIPYKANIQAQIIDGVHRIYLLEPFASLRKEEAYGPYFSVFSLGGPVEGLTIKGAKYPLENHRLLPYDSLSVSNQYYDERLEISYKSGLLIFIESKEA